MIEFPLIVSASSCSVRKVCCRVCLVFYFSACVSSTLSSRRSPQSPLYNVLSQKPTMSVIPILSLFCTLFIVFHHSIAQHTRCVGLSASPPHSPAHPHPSPSPSPSPPSPSPPSPSACPSPYSPSPSPSPSFTSPSAKPYVLPSTAPTASPTPYPSSSAIPITRQYVYVTATDGYSPNEGCGSIQYPCLVCYVLLYSFWFCRLFCVFCRILMVISSRPNHVCRACACLCVYFIVFLFVVVTVSFALLYAHC